jgi:hypothetical protein
VGCTLSVKTADTAVVEISKVTEARLGWTWWEEDVVQRYGVVLEGWTAGNKITDPSNLSTSQAVIRTLLEAVRTGECAFRKLGPVEAAERKAKWEEDVAAGRVVAKHRAPRCDAGRPRKRGRAEGDEGEEENDENQPPSAEQRPDNETVHAPAKKRARTTKNTTAAVAKRPMKTSTTAKTTGKKSTKKTAPGKKGARDDAITRGALERLKASSRSRIVSRAIITSDDERDDDPHANEDEAGAPAANSSAMVVYAPPTSIV